VAALTGLAFGSLRFARPPEAGMRLGESTALPTLNRSRTD